MYLSGRFLPSIGKGLAETDNETIQVLQTGI